MGRRWIVALLALTSWHAPAAAVDVIAHASQSESALSRSLARGIFGMRVRNWPDGTPVKVFVLADNTPLHDEFCKTVLQTYPYQLRQNWDRLLFSGTGQPPVEVASEDELFKRVAETPGAIGYLRQYRPPAPPAPPPPAKGKNKKTKDQPSPPPPKPPVKVLHVE